jgi:HEAT repeat protein
MLADAEARIRAIGVRAAAAVLPPPRWLPLLSDRDGEVRAAAVAAVAQRRTGIPDASDHLLRAMADRDPRVSVPRRRSCG